MPRGLQEPQLQTPGLGREQRGQCVPAAPTWSSAAPTSHLMMVRFPQRFLRVGDGLAAPQLVPVTNSTEWHCFTTSLSQWQSHRAGSGGLRAPTDPHGPGPSPASTR